MPTSDPSRDTVSHIRVSPSFFSSRRGFAAASDVVVEPARAHLQLGRAYVLAGDKVKALAYGNFLKLWKNADPDIPILEQAKSEYAKLQ